MKHLPTLLCAWLAALGLAASAHTVLEYQVASAGQSYKATFKVGHAAWKVAPHAL